jgi:hypothetical protein
MFFLLLVNITDFPVDLAKDFAACFTSDATDAKCAKFLIEFSFTGTIAQLIDNRGKFFAFPSLSIDL